MAIEPRVLLHFKTLANFKEKLADGTISPDKHLCFIKDEKLLWCRGEYYADNGRLDELNDQIVTDWAPQDGDVTSTSITLRLAVQIWNPDTREYSTSTITYTLQPATHDVAGLMIALDKEKLDRIDNVNHEFSQAKDATKRVFTLDSINPNDGSTITHSETIEGATNLVAGLMSADDKEEFDRVETANFQLDNADPKASTVDINAHSLDIDTNKSVDNQITISGATNLVAGVMTAEQVRTLEKIDKYDMFKTVITDDGSCVAEDPQDELSIVGGTMIKTAATDVGDSDTVTIIHKDVVRTDQGSTDSATIPANGTGVTITAVDVINSTAQGHITGVTKKTQTLKHGDEDRADSTSSNTIVIPSNGDAVTNTAIDGVTSSDQGHIKAVNVKTTSIKHGTTTRTDTTSNETITILGEVTGTDASFEDINTLETNNGHITKTNSKTTKVVHGNVTRTDNTATAATVQLGTAFAEVTEVTSNAKGHVTGVTKRNVTISTVLPDGTTATTQPSSDTSTKVATTAFVKSAFAEVDALRYSGALTPTATSPGILTPAATKGEVYKMTAAGYVDGVKVEAGDMIICNKATAAATSSNYATIAANWDFIQSNIEGYVLEDRQIIAGNGLTGGGSLAADRTINVVSANDGIVVSADNIKLDTINNLTSTSTTKPLSAAQGKAINDNLTTNYLPLTAGTAKPLTGNLIMSDKNVGIDISSQTGGWERGMYFYHGSTTIGKIGEYGNAATPTYIYIGATGTYSDSKNLRIYPTGNVQVGGIMTSLVGFANNAARISNLNIAKTGNDVLHISSFVSGGSNYPGSDSISGQAINDGYALTYFWQSDFASQIAFDIDGTGVAYRKYTPSTGASTAWKFLADTKWVSDKATTDLATKITKAGDSDIGPLKFKDATSNLAASGIYDASGQSLLCYNGSNTYIGKNEGTTYIRSGASNLLHKRNGTDYSIWDSYNTPIAVINKRATFKPTRNGWVRFVVSASYTYNQGILMIDNSYNSGSPRGITLSFSSGYNGSGSSITQLSGTNTWWTKARMVTGTSSTSPTNAAYLDLYYGGVNTNNTLYISLHGGYAVSLEVSEVDEALSTGFTAMEFPLGAEGMAATNFTGNFIGNLTGNATTSTTATKLEFERLSDLNSGTIGRFFTSSSASPTNAPTTAWTHGITLGPNNDVQYKTQIAFNPLSNAANLHIRAMSGGTWGTWRRVLTTDDVTILSTSYKNDPNSLPINQIFYAETQGVTGTPTVNGLVFSVQGNNEGIQLWADSSRTELYYRTKWSTYGNWIRLARATEIPSLSGYATQSWVNTQLSSYVAKSGSTMTGALTMSNRRNNVVVDVVGGNGNSWNEGAGALSVQVPNDSGQTPLLVARRSGTTINTTTAAERLLSMELLDTGNTFRIAMQNTQAIEFNLSSKIATVFGKTIATTDQIPSISISNSGSGNAVTAISASGHTLTVTKGASYLTSHQTIYAATFSAGAFSATTYTPNSAAKTISIPTHTSHLTNNSGFITSSALSGYATQSWANGQFASLALYNTTGSYSTIRTAGNEICIGNTAATSVSNQMLVNYRVPSGCTYAPNSWVWRAGSSSSLAAGYWGNLYMNDNLVATQTWANSQFQDARSDYAVLKDNGSGYYSICKSNAPTTDITYLRAGTSGILPNSSSSSGNGYVGTSSWPFLAMYSKTFYGNLSGNATTATTATNATNSTKWNGYNIAVVTSLPSSPDENTIYFVKG